MPPPACECKQREPILAESFNRVSDCLRHVYPLEICGSMRGFWWCAVPVAVAGSLA